MSYPRDLDEYTEAELTAELAQRARRRADGLCDYCGRPVTSSPCRMTGRHKPAGLTPTTGGEREAREALAVFDLPRCGRLLDWVIQWLRCNDVEGHAGSCSHDSRRDARERATVVTPEHLRTALALLATERAKAADADLLVAAEAVANSFNVGGDSIVSARTMTALRTAIARARGKDPT